jgi:hypothetical protein
MPTRVEGDLDLAISVDCSLEIVVEGVDAERVPIGESNRSAGLVPGSQRLAVPRFYQKPTPGPRAEAPNSEQVSIVTRLSNLPERAFLSKRCTEGLALPGRLQLEDLPFCGEDARDAGVLEERDDAGVRDRGNDGSRVSEHATNLGILPDGCRVVAPGREDAECHQARDLPHWSVQELRYKIKNILTVQTENTASPGAIAIAPE